MVPHPRGGHSAAPVTRTFLIDEVEATLDRVRVCLDWDGSATVVDDRHGRHVA
jgi:hypothetical protein